MIFDDTTDTKSWVSYTDNKKADSSMLSPWMTQVDQVVSAMAVCVADVDLWPLYRDEEKLYQKEDP